MLLIFDNRFEIINPGCLPNNLTVDDLKLGNAYQRNQLIANLCAKTMDYRNPTIERKELAKLLSMHESSVQRRLEALIKEGKIHRVDPNKGGHWEVSPE